MNQGKRVWHLCYHSTKYPVTNFVYLDDMEDVSHESFREMSFVQPNANSTFINQNVSHTTVSRSDTSDNATQASVKRNVSMRSQSPNHSVDQSHIPRKPPTPTTYTIPSFTNKSLVTENIDEDLFGMIKLKDNDICYTSGSIEWVGRKRSYPINSGFKIINDSFRHGNEPLLKKIKRLDKTYMMGNDQIKECDCADVLPTVNAIVDHLNALHEAIDLVDLRLNTLEDVVDK